MTTLLTEGLELLFERPGLPRFDLPGPVAARYAGSLGFQRPCVFANFVASVDGVVALAGAGESGHVISQKSDADRFVMAVLRACADAVMVGAGTLRKAAGDLWQPAAVYPEGTALFEETRERLGLRRQPVFVLVTASGEVDVTQPAFDDAIIVTTPAGEAKLRGCVPAGTRLIVEEGSPVRLARVLARLRAEGLGIVLAEGGPSLLARLVAEQVIDELFVTSSPALFGRYPDDGRKSLTNGIDLAGAPLELLSARRHGSHLFLRYRAIRK